MKTKTLAIVTSVVGLALADATMAVDPVLWEVNGHWYMPVSVPNSIEWQVAQNEAEAVGGYLVTITSQGENDFVFTLIDDDAYWVPCCGNDVHGPWLGAVQVKGSPEPDGGWMWITGEQFEYSAWASGQPNNAAQSNQNRIDFFNTEGIRTPTWNDASEFLSIIPSYVVEWDTQPCFTADLDEDGIVGIGDFLLVLAQWGPCPPACFGDVDGDNTVGINDLLLVLANWGPCP